MTSIQPVFLEITSPEVIATLNDLLTNGEFRPVWATRGERKEAWEALTQQERYATILLLHGYRASDLASKLKLDLDQTVALMSATVTKLGFATPADLVEHHARAGFRLMEQSRKSRS